MHAAIRRVGIHARDMEKVIDKVDTEFLAIMSELPGFVSYYMVKTKEDEIISFTIFEGEEQAQEANKIGLKWIKENIIDSISSPPQPEGGKVVIHGGN